MIPPLRTDPVLLAQLRTAAKHELTAAETRLQRISFAVSCSDLPRDQVVRIVDRVYGVPRP